MKEVIPSQTIGQRIAMIRNIANLSEQEFCDELDIPIEELHNIELDFDMINPSIVLTIAEDYNLPYDFILEGNTSELDCDILDKITKYIQDFDYASKIKLAKITCKNKIVEDGLPFNKEYLPIFDYDNIDYISYGIFNEQTFPIHVEKSCQNTKNELYINLPELSNTKAYGYNIEKLIELDLIDKLQNLDSFNLASLNNCDNIKVIREIMLKLEEEYDEDYTETLYNHLLETLNPKLKNYWKIIVLLIDSGAFYTKQLLQTDNMGHILQLLDVKDESKTNIIYRLAKDHIK